MSRSRALLFFVAYLFFVVYGSLLPFEIRSLSFSDAILRFQHIQFLNLGVVSRADWIANILLYIPLAFLGCNCVERLRGRVATSALAVGLVTIFCLFVAVAVEFAQQFFAPRTVSLNDLVAETIGTFLGVGLWVFGREKLSALWHAFRRGGRESLLAAIALYLLLYLVLSLFPYDFVISLVELKAKLASGNLGWILAGNSSSVLRVVAIQLAEMAAIAPLGLLLGLVSSSLDFRRLFLAGMVLGMLLELLQLPLASGVSQGLSVLLRGAGLVAGAGLARLIRRLDIGRISRLIWKLALFCALPYVVTVAALNGWFDARWVSLTEGAVRLAEANLLPFYYHYYTSETVAVASLLAQVAMYMPVGIAVWAKYATLPYRARGKLLSAGSTAMLLALPIELGKAIVPGAHPDFTNVLIAGFGAVMACASAQWLESVLRGGVCQGKADENMFLTTAAPQQLARPLPLHPIGTGSGVVAAVAAVTGVIAYPVGNLVLALAMSAYALALLRQPWLWLFALSALLPVLDLSQVTGRLLLDEFDLLVLVTLAVGYWRCYSLPVRCWPNRLLPVAYGLLWLTWAVAMALGLWPLYSLPEKLVASSHSPYEAWYVGKGMLWVLLLVPLLRRIPDDQTETAQRLLVSGLVTGLALLCCVVVWERHVFVGLGDFQNVFRVTGSFSSMATGGAYIEAYIAFVFPVLAVWILQQQGWWARLAGVFLAGLASYAMMVTFSRGGYAALATGFTVVGFAVVRWRTVSLSRRALVMAGVLVAAVVVALPVLKGDFAKARLSQSAEDLHTRLAHWGRALDIMDDGFLTALGGMGFGRYPAQYLFNADVANYPGNYSVLRENDETFVRLGVGEPVYLDQLVEVEPGSIYQLSARMRSPFGKSELKVIICEKALLTSFDCVAKVFAPAKDDMDAEWFTATADLELAQLGRGGNWPHRSVKLSLFNPGSGNLVDVEALSFISADGEKSLANGDFASGVARWLFVSDQDLAWHIHQQEIEMYFAQGWLGLLAFALLLLALTECLWPALRQGDPFATAISGAVVAFLIVGLLGSTMDTARLSMLFYLGVLTGCVLLPATIWRKAPLV